MNRDEIEKTNLGVLVEKNGGSNLLVVFGGIQQGIGVPVFEFFNTLQGISCDKIFFRDFNQTWYHKGVDKELKNIDSMVSYLKEILISGKYERVCFLGNSMGGYAAILFGVLLNVDTVVAFAPQTFIDRFHRWLYFDFRWRKELKNVFSIPKHEPRYFDLKTVLKRRPYQTRISLYYSPADRLDKIHADRMKNLPHIHVMSVTQGGHSLVKTLRDNGELQAIVLNALLPKQ